MRRKSSTRNLIQRQIRSSIHIIDVGFEPGPLRLIPHFSFNSIAEEPERGAKETAISIPWNRRC